MPTQPIASSRYELVLQDIKLYYNSNLEYFPAFIPLFLAVWPQETVDYWPKFIVCLTLDKFWL